MSSSNFSNLQRFQDYLNSAPATGGGYISELTEQELAAEEASTQKKPRFANSTDDIVTNNDAVTGNNTNSSNNEGTLESFASKLKSQLGSIFTSNTTNDTSDTATKTNYSDKSSRPLAPTVEDVEEDQSTSDNGDNVPRGRDKEKRRAHYGTRHFSPDDKFRPSHSSRKSSSSSSDDWDEPTDGRDRRKTRDEDDIHRIWKNYNPDGVSFPEFLEEYHNKVEGYERSEQSGTKTKPRRTQTPFNRSPIPYSDHEDHEMSGAIQSSDDEDEFTSKTNDKSTRSRLHRRSSTNHNKDMNDSGSTDSKADSPRTSRRQSFRDWYNRRFHGTQSGPDQSYIPDNVFGNMNYSFASPFQPSFMAPAPNMSWNNNSWQSGPGSWMPPPGDFSSLNFGQPSSNPFNPYNQSTWQSGFTNPAIGIPPNFNPYFPNTPNQAFFNGGYPPNTPSPWANPSIGPINIQNTTQSSMGQSQTPGTTFADRIGKMTEKRLEMERNTAATASTATSLPGTTINNTAATNQLSSLLGGLNPFQQQQLLQNLSQQGNNLSWADRIRLQQALSGNEIGNGNDAKLDSRSNEWRTASVNGTSFRVPPGRSVREVYNTLTGGGFGGNSFF
ncbi:uncharacterized protein L201_001729 [Kwoniella dendrophila CBS 6074]|uniref:Uncharacterized protein n=1 Tax=Kwoniella dendrophila CBS 6074 TaxID=1295534 RepID=A0AAX4JQK7_9TREE